MGGAKSSPCSSVASWASGLGSTSDLLSAIDAGSATESVRGSIRRSFWDEPFGSFKLGSSQSGSAGVCIESPIIGGPPGDTPLAFVVTEAGLSVFWAGGSATPLFPFRLDVPTRDAISSQKRSDRSSILSRIHGGTSLYGVIARACSHDRL